ncbi:ABC transporter substrate-binding protein [Nocardia alni]|uniref:ABC transporter substrate-binding protein n=1 Tax=Nocardia alni TaxID=2815723 RepID=UPI001C236FD8|nr:ABC transporter substrate-binding protein [Nocardia alni]
MITRRSVLQAGLVLPFAAACGPNILRGGSGTLRVAVTWSGNELAAFQAVLAGIGQGRSAPAFRGPVEVVPLGDDIDTALNAGGSGAPDIIMLPDAGRISVLAGSRLRAVRDTLWAPPGGDPLYRDNWWDLLWYRNCRDHAVGHFGVPFKGAYKSLVWYDRDAVAPDGQTLGDMPRDWYLEDWPEQIARFAAAGRHLFALGAADGWVLAYHFANVLCAVAPNAYQALSKFAPVSGQPAGAQDVSWDRPDVRAAFGVLGELWGTPGAFPGGVAETLRRQFPDAVRDVFQHRSATMVVAPDYAEPIVRECLRQRNGSEASVGVMPFPALTDGRVAPSIGGADILVITTGAAESADDLAAALAARTAPDPWVTGYGGFVQPRGDAPTPASYAGLFRDVAPNLNNWTMFDFADLVGPRGRRDGLWRVLTRFLTDTGPAATDRAIADLQNIWQRGRSGQRRSSRPGNGHPVQADACDRIDS